MKRLLNIYCVIFVLLVVLSVYCGLSFAGFSIGMPGAVRNTLKALETNKRNDLTIKGNFTGAGSSSIRKFGAGETITKIAVVTYRFFRVTDVSGSDFSVPIMSNEIGKPIGLVFINDLNKVAGCLQMVTSSTDTLNLLPLTKVQDGVTQIDLQKISFSTDTAGNIAVPEYDPVGENKEIPLTQDEKLLAAKITKVFGSILKDSDINDNGVVDYLENMSAVLGFSYSVRAGQVQAGTTDGDYTVTTSTELSLDIFKTYVKIFPDRIDNDLPITFPAGYTWNHGGHAGGPMCMDNGTTNSAGPGGGTMPPIDGDYVVDATSLGHGTLTFHVTGQQDAIDSILLIKPTFHVSGGKLKKITWIWKAYNNQAGDDIDSSAFVDNILIQIGDGTFKSYNNDGTGYFAWAGTTINGTEKEHVIGVNNLDWAADCINLGFSYDDKFGNRVGVNYKR